MLRDCVFRRWGWQFNIGRIFERSILRSDWGHVKFVVNQKVISWCHYMCCPKPEFHMNCCLYVVQSFLRFRLESYSTQMHDEDATRYRLVLKVHINQFLITFFFSLEFFFVSGVTRRISMSRWSPWSWRCVRRRETVVVWFLMFLTSWIYSWVENFLWSM